MFALVGVTASGKSEIAIRLCEPLRTEIICADAMTIWTGLDIGTAKPSGAQRERVAHHLLDIAEPGSRPTVANVAAAAEAAIRDIRARGKTPLVVGGSGLYVRAIVDGLEFPPTDAGLRSTLEALPPDEALRRLAALDPVSLERLDVANRRRVVRALEISILTGRPASSQRSARADGPEVVMVGLDLDDVELTARIRSRTGGMLDGGWLDECRRFDAAGRRAEVLATQAIGYREVFALLDGERTRAETEDEIVRATLRLTRRQRTWFRADPRVIWLDAADLDAVVEQVLVIFATAASVERHT
jgi:tRNA dimethylallyltransferase